MYLHNGHWEGKILPRQEEGGDNTPFIRHSRYTDFEMFRRDPKGHDTKEIHLWFSQSSIVF